MGQNKENEQLTPCSDPKVLNCNSNESILAM